MNFQKFHPHSPRKQAFTLVELLVSLAVLSILVLILAQVVSLTGEAISINSKKLTAAAQARAFFDRFAIDFAARPQRPDLRMTFAQNNNNAFIQFYSAAGGYGAATPRQLSWISYGISSPKTTTSNTANAGPDCLVREADAADWVAGAGTPVLFAPLTSLLPAAPAPNALNADVLASGIFRMDFCYLLKDGSLSTTPTIPNAPNLPNDYSQVAAVVIGVAALDNRSLNILSNAQVTQLAGDLPATTTGQDPLSNWTATMAVPTFGAGIPHQVVQNIRLYQRTFYVP
jgi:prepilin-type N-terminal cleavage/methylation domain-containing protein